jgi:CHAD domain-containing protein
MEKGYQLHRKESLADSLRRICAWQTARTAKIVRDETKPLDERVHEARKRIKETRALLRLFRGALGDAFDDENHRFRDAGRELAPYRDTKTVVEAIKSLPPRVREAIGPKAMRALRNFANERQQAQFGDESALRARFESLIVQLAGANGRLTQAPLPHRSRVAITEDGLARTISDGKRAMASAFKSGTDADFHEWRKRVKDLNHHIELLINVWPKMMTALEKETSTLAQHLGHHHDLALVADVLDQTEGTLGDAAERHRIGRLIAAQQKRAIALARPIAERIYSVRPRRMARAIATLWDVWRA